MNELSVVEVFPQEVVANKEMAISARILFEWLETDMSNFNKNFKTAINRAGLDESDDYTSLVLEYEQKKGGHNKKDYALTPEAAKHIAMISDKAKGKEVRKYFIEVEKNSMATQPMTDIEKYQALLDQAKQIKVLETENKRIVLVSNRGQKALASKRGKQLERLKDAVGVDLHRDVIPMIESLKYKSLKLDEVRERYLARKKLQAENPTPKAIKVPHHTPTALGKVMGLSPIKMNNLLELNGFQYFTRDNGKKEWYPTEKAQPYFEIKESEYLTPDGCFQKREDIRWRMEILGQLER